MSAERLAPRSVAGRIAAEWPSFLDPPLARPASLPLVAASLGAGVIFDIAIRAGIVGLAGAASIAAAAATLLIRVRTTHARVLAALAPVFGLWLAIRTSPWLLPLDIVAAASLLALAATLSRGGSLWDTSIPQATGRGLQAGVQAILAPSFLLAPSHRDESRGHAAAIARGVALALPLLIILGALFASSDAVFGRLLHFDPRPTIARAIVVAIGALGMGALLRIASVEHVEGPRVRRPHLGPTEWTVALALVDLLFLVFAATQAFALSQGGRRVVRTAGLTYAQYARSGFFQLLAAAALTVGALLALRAVAAVGDSERRRFRLLAVSMVALTLVVVVSAFVRLTLYERAFGVTMLRLYAHTAIVWVGIVLVLLALSVLGVASHRHWVAPAAGAAALVLLFGLNVMNPEAFVARYNARANVRIDPSYVSELSDDAIGSLGRRDVCSVIRTSGGGWAGFNAARHHGDALRARAHCIQGD